jgi:hypothetical protein
MATDKFPGLPIKNMHLFIPDPFARKPAAIL